MKLALQTKSNGSNATADFYRSLGWIEVSEHLWTDGKIAVKISTDPKDRAGLIIYDLPDSDIEQLSSDYPSSPWKNGLIIQAPSGCLVHIVNESMPSVNANPEASLPGKYAGVSLESLDITASITFWQLLGYEINAGKIEQGWISLGNTSGDVISIMSYGSCPHAFINPSLTYFNGSENPAIINEIRSRHIPIEEEITVFNPNGEVDNVFLRDPGGIGFFVFNDG